MINGFDELNTLKTVKNIKKSKNRSIPYEEYFSIMHLTDKQKKQRKKFAELLEDDLIMIMTLWADTRRYNIRDDTFIIEELKNAYIKVSTSFGVPSDGYLSEIAYVFALNFVNALWEHSDDEWYVSEDRAKYNAENEANTVLNYKDFIEAKDKGYTKKRWRTMEDEKVRLTHSDIDGEVVGIDELFVVGDSLMRYPKDIEYGSPEEWINCRCSIEYL